MKTKNRMLSVLTVLALVASLFVVMVAPAAATGPATLTLTPDEGPPGTRVRVIGAGFPGNAPGLLTAPVGVIDPVAFTTGGGGEIALIVTILAGARAGDHYITATVGDYNVTERFTVTVRPAALALSPRSGLPGAEVTATGVRFPINAPGMLSAPGIISPVTFMTTAAGAIPATVVTILPGAEVGVHLIEATVGGIFDTAAFTVLEVDVPSITLTPDRGPRGMEVEVSGSNFPAGSPGVITAPGIVAPVVFTTDDAGEFDDVMVTILGAAPFGLATITATVGVVSDGAHFVVLPPVAPSITLSPTSGSPRTVVTVTGVAFRPDTAGVIVGPGLMHPIGFTTTSAGAIPATDVRILPGAPFGAASITATVGVESDDATFTVRSPAIVISPPGGVRGADVRIPVARGFPINAEGMITSPGVISPVAFTTDATGNAVIPIAPSILLDAPLGEATFTATVTVAGVTTQATATYIVGITPTITISPTIGFEGTKVEVRGHGFPDRMRVSITSPDVLAPGLGVVVDDYGRIPATVVTILTGAPVGAATITVAVGDYSATAVFSVAGPGVPVIVPEPIVPVLEGLADVWDLLGKSVLEFREGNWYRHHTNPEKHELIPAAHRLAELKSGGAYWIYLTEDITDVMIGGVLRTHPAGWVNIGWVL